MGTLPLTFTVGNICKPSSVVLQNSSVALSTIASGEQIGYQTDTELQFNQNNDPFFVVSYQDNSASAAAARSSTCGDLYLSSKYSSYTTEAGTVLPQTDECGGPDDLASNASTPAFAVIPPDNN